MTRRITTLLVANRGEIAVRVIRTCREMGIRSVAVCSDPDRNALHVRMADAVIPIGGSTASESYLRQDRIIEAARAAGADAVHPGYGFLSENPEFAERVEAAGLIFVGPASSAIRTMGDKTAARKVARDLGIPTVPGTLEPLRSLDEARSVASDIGFPVLLKAAAGGGGKGMRIVRDADTMASAFEAARSEARSAFGDDRVFMEKYLQQPRHVEIQILGDRHGTMLWLGERECSIQRRHQKVMEESPSPAIDDRRREAMGQDAVRLASAAGYTNAGTMEFILDGEGRYYFLEMNTRLQVEHPVTEMITGFDLVRLQLHIAQGEKLSITQSDIVRRGHAIECRVYAEDPESGFLPSTGRVTRFRLPQGPRVRSDSGIEEGDRVEMYYDPLLAKIVCWGTDRTEAIAAMERALGEMQVAGVSTTVPFCKFVLAQPEYRSGTYDTHFAAAHFTQDALAALRRGNERFAAIAAALVWNRGERRGSCKKNPDNNSQWKNKRTDQHR